MSTITERVAAGAALLDEHRPGWADHINLDVLDVDDCEVCVLGQLFQDEAGEDAYMSGLLTIGLRSGKDPEFAHGFDGGWSEIDALTAEWKRVIRQRRATS